jgi:Cu/Ag efflux protein CusF
MKVILEIPIPILLLALAACAPYRAVPLSTDHPAHIDAAVAPQMPRSQTLAYTTADVSSVRSVASGAAETKMDETAKTVTAEGKVVAAVPGSGQIVLEHGEIKGFMDAMTMGYRVDPPTLVQDLKFGDRVRFTIDVAKKTIVKLEKLQ